MLEFCNYGLINLRSGSSDANSTLAMESENRQYYRERRMEEDRRQREEERRQREIERNETREDKEKDREDRKQSQMLMAGVFSRLIPGGSTDLGQLNNKNIELQYEPDSGSEPFPKIVTLSTLSALLRF